MEIMELVTSSYGQLLEFILRGYQAVGVVVDDFQMFKDLI
jgi:hypothetical protein